MRVVAEDILPSWRQLLLAVEAGGEVGGVEFPDGEVLEEWGAAF